MTRQIPIQVIANQAFTIVLDNNTWDFTIKATNGVMSIGLSLNGSQVIENLRAVAGMRLIPSRYEEAGNFVFYTQNFELPDYLKFNVTQILVYYSASELAAIRAPEAPPITAADFNPIASLPLRFAPRDISVTSAFDQRIVKVGLQLPGGPVSVDGLSIYAAGRKYASAIMNECECKLFNLTREQQNYLLTAASPLARPGQSRTPVNMTLDVGRESYGTFRLFEGYVFQGGMTQPPDIGVVLRSLTNNLLTGVIAGASQPQLALLSVIAAGVALANGLTLSFQATDRQISNWSVSGSAQQQIVKLGQVGGIDSFVDNATLVIIDSKRTRSGDSVPVNASTGMVGIPQVTDSGVLVKVMINNAIELGGSVTIQSELNPAANGTFKVVQINFEVASRDQPFWYTLACSNLAYYQGSQ